MRGVLPCLLLLCGCAGAAQRAKGALVPFAVEAPGSGARKFALVVGIGSFEDPSWQPLKWAEKDATDLAAELQGFDTRLLTRREETSRAAVLTALRDLRASAGNPDDTVLLYFSSHGTLDREPGGALSRFVVTSDTRRELARQTGLSVDELFRELSKFPSRRKAVVFAFCHSGKGKSALPDELQQALSHLKGTFFVKPIEEASEATVVASASAFGETAAEDDGLQNDIYTHFFVQALREGIDGNHDGAVTITEAHEYARDRTYYFTAGTQRPSLELQMDGADPVVLKGARQRAGQPVLFSYATSAAGLALLVNGTQKGELPGSVVLEPGTQTISLVDAAGGGELYSETLELSPGEVLDVARLIPPPVTLDGGAGPGVLWFFSGRYASEILPAAPTLSAAGSVRNWPWRRFELRLSLDYLHTSGSIPVGSASVPFTTDAAAFRFGPGTSLRLGELRLSGAVQGGALVFHRRLRYPTTAFASSETVLDAFAGATLSLDWNLWGPLWVSLAASPGILFARLADGVSAQPFGAAALLITAGR